MKSKLVHTRSEADEISALIKQKLVSDTSTQKGIRDKIRKRGFWAGEFKFAPGYTVEDFLSVVKISGERTDVGAVSELPVNRVVKPIKEGKKPATSQSDEAYIIDLCDEVLGITSLRQHRFEFLKGDAETKLPVDAYYPLLNLVIEYRERQHTEVVKFFDIRETISGIGRGEQRKKYDQLRRDVLPANNIKLIELGYDDFEHTKAKRLVRNKGKDITTIAAILKKHQIIKIEEAE